MKIIYDKYYVYRHYILKENGEEDTFYIGKGISGRFADTNRNKRWLEIVKANNNEFQAEILEYFDSEDEAYAKEKELQEKYWQLGQCLGCADLYHNKKMQGVKNTSFIQELKTNKAFRSEFRNFLINLDIKNVMFTFEEICENFQSFDMNVFHRGRFSKFIDARKLKENIFQDFLQERHFTKTWSMESAFKNAGVSKQDIERKAKEIYKNM